MKALIYSTNKAIWGGSEELWKKLSIDAANNGHQVLASAFNHSQKEAHFGEMSAHGIQIQRRDLSTYPEATSFIELLKSYRTLATSKNPSNTYWREIKGFDPNILVFNLGEAFETDFLLQLEALKKNVFGKLKYKIIVHFISDEFARISDEARADFRLLYANALDIYFVSHANALALKRQLGISALDYKILNNQLSSLIQTPSLPFPATKKINLAIVARLEHSIKGQDVLLSLIQNYPQKEKITFNFYGDGPSKEHLKNLIFLYHLQNCAVLKGYEDYKSTIWTTNDALLLCSKDEGLPLSLLEAMNFGRTFICTPAGGIADLDSDLGFLFDALDASSLYTILDGILADKSTLMQKGAACKEWLNSYNLVEPTFIL